jgi:hypothetical protein
MGVPGRATSGATILVLVLLTVGAASLSTTSIPPTSTTTTVPPAISGGPVSLLADGVGTALFGEPESRVITVLDRTFGRPTATNYLTNPGNCGIGAIVRWGEISTFYSQGTFTGYRALGSNASYPSGGGFYAGGVGNQGVTRAGLRVGDTLDRARALYGSSLTTSAAQGGSWSVQTSAGELRGYLSGVVGHASMPLLIDSIGAGNVGCPAVSP